MSAETNKAIVRRMAEEVFNKGNLSIIPELIAPNYVYHTTPEYKGPEGFKNYITMVRKAFPDLHMKIDYMVAEGDMVAIFYTYGGTFKGEMMGIKGEMKGIAPTGKKFTLKLAILSRFADGKEVEAWPYSDLLSLYRQLGISVPTK
jgi:predicted ester cyclase